MQDKKIGLQIKKARAESQLSQSQLGKKIGVTWEMISRYENGKSSPRKNLEKIAKALGKPIQYFFGVEEVPLSDEIKRLSELLEKKGKALQKGAEVPFVESLEGFSLPKALKLTNQSYTCPGWIYSKYKKVFSYKLDEVESNVVSVGRGDIGFFSSSLKAKLGSYVLVKDVKNFRIEKYSKTLSKKIHAVLLAIEKRYYSD
ncbi:helix-turn-helix domain-containing protein [Candidatus Dojkabacteria bacterium]|nr:helix-turn-helix domain-containing protein [Candidatus Dojkabacteria bacterium]